MDSLLWQCSCTWCIRSLWVSGKEIHYKNKPSTLFTRLKFLWLSAISKIEKFPERTKICWHLWHPLTCDYIIERYPGKQVPRMFPAMAPSSHKVHSFTKGVIWRWQQPTVSRKANFAFTGTYHVPPKSINENNYIQRTKFYLANPTEKFYIRRELQGSVRRKMLDLM